MTAYANQEIKGDWGNATWEIRSVNHRYLEIYFHLPEQFRRLEPIIRERINFFLVRGKVECSLRFELDNNIQDKLVLNKKFVKQLIETANWISLQSNGNKINPMDILRWPNIVIAEKQNHNMVTITEDIFTAFDNVLNSFIIVRKKEGDILNALVKQRLEKINIEIKKIRSHMPKIFEWQRKRLISKLKNSGINFESNRLEQELVLIYHRIDIAEELERLETHINEIDNILRKEEAVGRRLDFVIQECNRELNTLASKSIDMDITNSTIELKVLIEQIREQVQNIE